MNLFKRKLTLRLIALSVLVFLAALVALSYIAFFSAERIIVSRVQSHLESVSVLKEQEITSWKEHLGQHLIRLTDEPRIESNAEVLVTEAPGSLQYTSAQQMLSAELDKRRDEDRLTKLVMMNTSGLVVAASDRQWEGKIFDRLDFFEKGQQGVYYSDIHHNMTFGAPTMIVSGPVIDDAGGLLGVLAGYVQLDSLNEVMLEWSGLGETGDTYLVNQDYLMLTDPRTQPGVAFHEWAYSEGVTQAINEKSAVGVFKDYREVPVIGYYRWLDDMKAVLVAKMDQQEAFAPISHLRNTILFAGIGLIVMVTGVVAASTRQIVNPLAKLAEYSRKIQNGEDADKPDISGQDEIASLAADIEVMVDKLRDREARLRTLSRGLVEVQEEERRAIARELHDQTSQSLALVKISLDRAMNAPVERLQSLIAGARETLSEIIAQVRQISLDLRPSMLDDLGLLQALNWHLDHYSKRTNIVVDFKQNGLDGYMPPDVRIAAFRIVQEALSNVARHSKAGEVSVRAWVLNGTLNIIVNDAGIGFDPSSVPSSSIGLSAMKERVGLLKGEFTIDSAPGQGTCISVGLPLGGEQGGE